MIGNDIIDLNEAKCASNWERPGFLEKIFTSKEQSYIENSTDPFTTVWRLWSMKESAYKVFIQNGGKPFFSPKSIDCSIDSSKNGEARIDGATFKTSTFIHSDYIFSTVTNDEKNLDTSIFKLRKGSPKQQSEFIYEKLLNAYSKKHYLNINELQFKKTAANVPFLEYKNVILSASISITHHGKYGAYSILKS